MKTFELVTSKIKKKKKSYSGSQIPTSETKAYISFASSLLRFTYDNVIGLFAARATMDLLKGSFAPRDATGNFQSS